MTCKINFALAIALMIAASSTAQTPASPPSSRNPQAENVTGQPNISGVWVVEAYVVNTRPQSERLMKTIDGARPPLQPWAAKLYQDRADETDAGRPYATTAAQCLPGGMPAMMLGAPYPFQIIQSPGQISTLHMEMRTFRLIYLDEKLPEDPDPTFIGYSVGRWEGDTLVVETSGLNDKTSIDYSGMPHTEQLRITERIRRIADDQLENILTFDDPGTFTKPWTTRRTYKLQPPGERVIEYICEIQHNPVDEKGQSTFRVPGN